MKKLALVFILAVLVPSLVLGWLAFRSLRDQQFLLERQQSLLYQRVTDSLAGDISARLAQAQQEFASQVEDLAANRQSTFVAAQFDEELHQRWPLAEVGFCVTLSGKILSPLVSEREEAKSFFTENSSFLCNRAPAEVYNNANFQMQQGANPDASALAQKQKAESPSVKLAGKESDAAPFKNSYTPRSQARKVSPQNTALDAAKDAQSGEEGNLSKIAPAEAEFAQLVGDRPDGMLARFLQNKLRLMFWHRLKREPNLVFGAQLDLKQMIDTLRPLLKTEELAGEICLALLDENARPVVISRPGFQGNWKRPFASTEVGEALPHWEIAAYLINPAQFKTAARTAEWTLGLLIAVLLLTIAAGSWLIVHNLNAELKLARQKTDFVSNVSHELKTPLTSIRMFSELLAEGRVTELGKQKSYLQIISAEASRLTRLINNVLDFARMERRERKYTLAHCDLPEIVRETADTFRPHFEENGFHFECEIPAGPLWINGDRDALSQVIVNLLSNAEKYAGTKKEILVRLAAENSWACVKILDRGVGVPRGFEEKIFEQFFRAHDALSSGIQGSGLGLTLARQIARAHGGDLSYEPRDGGGSCFTFRVPVKNSG
ncbi:MAG: HAMP domain-containing sensor histidine kinase [Verrucomicrobiota bacterium]